MLLNFELPNSSNVISIIGTTIWMISQRRFGSTHFVVESPSLGIRFWYDLGERFVNTHYVVKHTTLGILIYSLK